MKKTAYLSLLLFSITTHSSEHLRWMLTSDTGKITRIKRRDALLVHFICSNPRKDGSNFKIIKERFPDAGENFILSLDLSRVENAQEEWGELFFRSKKLEHDLLPSHNTVSKRIFRRKPKQLKSFHNSGEEDFSDSDTSSEDVTTLDTETVNF